MTDKLVRRQDLLDAFKLAGLAPGDTVMVHASLRSLGYVCGGAQAVIQALIDAVGEQGTLMMPFQSTGAVKTVPLGSGGIRSMSQPELVDFAVSWIEKNRK